MKKLLTYIRRIYPIICEQILCITGSFIRARMRCYLGVFILSAIDREIGEC